ncbi:MAG: hypothetical protein ACLQCB_03380 [Spirochaetia bacterium]
MGSSLGAEATGRGCGKLILFGEHAAVFGFPALGVSLPEQTRVVFRGPPLASWDLAGVPAADQEVVRRILDKVSAVLPELRGCGGRAVRIESSVVRGVGFGSSAALCAATAAAAIDLIGGTEPAALSRVWEVAHELERVFHGTPSGIDTGLSLLPGLTAFSPRPPALPAWERVESALWVVVGALPRSTSTGALVRGVGERMRSGDPAVRGSLSMLGGMAARARELLRDKSARDEEPTASGIGRLADEAMRGLAALGLSNPSLEVLLEEGRRSGARGGKLSGAGGGGAFFLVCSDAQAADRTAQRLVQFAGGRGISFAATPRVLRVG